MTLFDKGIRVSALIASLGVTAAALGTTGYGPTEFSPRSQLGQDQAQQAIEDGNRALAESRFQDAIAHFERALELSPGNAEASAGLEQARVAMDEGSTVGQVQDDLELRRQRTLAEFDAAMANAQQLLDQDQFGQARQTLLTARVQLDQGAALLSESDYQSRAEQADAMLAEVDHQEEMYDLAEQDRIAQEIREQKEREQAEEMRKRQEQVYQNLVKVRELQLRRDYDEALATIDQVLFLDEDNPVALALRDAIVTAQLWDSFIDNERAREFSYSWNFEANRGAMLAPHSNFSGPGPKSTTGLMTYPEDWPQLSVMRTSGNTAYTTVENRRVAAAFENTGIDMVQIDNTFEQVLGYLQDVTGENVVADWKSLELIGVDRGSRVKLALQNVPARVVLERALEQLGDEVEQPHYAVHDGLMVVASEDAIRQHVVTLVYDIRDLLFEVPYFDNAPSFDLSEEMNAAQAAASRSAFDNNNDYLASMDRDRYDNGRSGRDEGMLFSDGGQNPAKPNREQIVEKVTDVIMQNIDRDGWVDFGGSTGVIQELSGNLVITQTPRNHRSIQGLLSQLREIRALQINMESRFLTVDMNWFEKIGFDLDLYFNTDSDLFQAARAVDPLFQLGDFFDERGRLQDPLTTYPTVPAGPPLRTVDGFTPFGITQDSFNLVDLLGGFASNSFAGTILTSNPAVVMGISFLDDIQVDLLVEATQADRRNVVLTAPRLSLFNGQRSFVVVGTQQAIVTGLIPIVGDNSGAFQPLIGTILDGVVLDVEAVISADRRYVTLTIITGLRETVNIETLEFGGAAGGGGTGGGTAGQFTGTISLPEVEASIVNTSASVPDRGTLLIGGQRLVQEVEVETGVPILSKIPFINRFFTNRVTSKDESTLLILIRPEIIIQQENEDQLFPGLGGMLGGPY